MRLHNEVSKNKSQVSLMLFDLSRNSFCAKSTLGEFGHSGDRPLVSTYLSFLKDRNYVSVYDYGNHSANTVKAISGIR